MTESDAVEGLPPSAKFVLYVLDEQADRDLDYDDLHEETGLPVRTIRYATTRLEERSLVERRPSPGDGRRFRYRASRNDKT